MTYDTPPTLVEQLAVHLRETQELAARIAVRLRHHDVTEDTLADFSLLARALGHARRRARTARGTLRLQR